MPKSIAETTQDQGGKGASAEATSERLTVTISKALKARTQEVAVGFNVSAGEVIEDALTSYFTGKVATLKPAVFDPRFSDCLRLSVYMAQEVRHIALKIEEVPGSERLDFAYRRLFVEGAFEELLSRHAELVHTMKRIVEWGCPDLGESGDNGLKDVAVSGREDDGNV